MRKGLKTGMKVSSIVLGGLLALFLVVMGVLGYFVFTPKRITPIVQHVVNDALSAEIHLENVDVTFFSTFPRLGICLEQGEIVVPDPHKQERTDTLSRRRLRDSLLTFAACRVEFEPFAFLFKQRLLIHEISLDSAQVFAWRDTSGFANWETLMPAKDTVQVADTSSFDLSSFDVNIPGVTAVLLRQLSINDARISYRDRVSRTSVLARDVDVKVRVGMMDRGARLSLDFDCAGLSVRQGRQSWARRMALSFHGKMGWNRETKCLTFKESTLGVNDIHLLVDGTALPLPGGLFDLDLDLGAEAPSVEKMLALIPKHLMSQEGLKADGKIAVSGHVKGLLGEGHLPVLQLGLTVDEASASYKGLPYAVDYLAAEFETYLDKTRNDTSFVDLKIFQLRGMNTDVLLKAKMTDLFADPLLSVQTEAKVDLAAIAGTFPWKSGVELSGNLDADLRLRMRLSTLQNQDWGRIFALGKVMTDGVVVRDTTSGFELNSQAALRFFGGKSLGAEAEISQFSFQTEGLRAAADSLHIKVRSDRPKDTLKLFKVNGDAQWRRLMARQDEGLRIFSRRGSLEASLSPRSDRPDRQQLKFGAAIDTFSLRLGETRALLNHAELSLLAKQLNDTLWMPEADMEVSRVSVRTPQFELPIRMRKAKLGFHDRQLKLEDTYFKIGQSDVRLKGTLEHPYEALVQGKKLKGALEVTSKEMNVGQLLSAWVPVEDSSAVDGVTPDAASLASAESWQEMEQQEQQLQEAMAEADRVAEQAPADSTKRSLRLIQVPENIEFTFQTSIDRLLFDALEMRNIEGKIEVKDRYVYLENLNLNTFEQAQIHATLIYQAATPRRGYAGFELQVKDVDVDNVLRAVPALDSLVPMLQSFHGLINVQVSAESVMDSLMNLQIPSLRAAMNIRGNDLVLLDGKTFAEISKLLMFRNKDKNLIDEISVNMTVEEGQVTIYPFLVEMDRYKAAAGGIQNLDMSFDYHISILESPLPFKAGVNIRGTMDDMRFGIGKAKYKNAVTPVEIKKIDSLRLNFGEEITRRFKKVSERKRWGERAKSRSRRDWQKSADSLRTKRPLRFENDLGDSIQWHTREQIQQMQDIQQVIQLSENEKDMSNLPK